MEKGKPVEVTLRSSVDGREQPNIVQLPQEYDKGRPLPLLVGLHTWSGDYKQQIEEMAPAALKRGWLLVLPRFRGPNVPENPKPREACASILAQHDIVDCVNHMTKQFSVDRSRIYLVGASGGGHMSLMMAGKYPDLWAGVSAWCGITDIAVWHRESDAYRRGIEACAGGKPGQSPEVDWEYFRRSPVHFIANALNTRLDIRHGRKDNSVPCHHSVDAFARLQAAGATHSSLDVFDGGHEIHLEQALDWLAKQEKDDRPPARLNLTTDEEKSYYYAHLVPAEEMAAGRCEIHLQPDGGITLSVEALKELCLNWPAMQMKKAHCHIHINPAPGAFRLRIEKIPPPRVSCADEYWSTWRYAERTRTLTIAVKAGEAVAYGLEFS